MKRLRTGQLTRAVHGMLATLVATVAGGLVAGVPASAGQRPDSHATVNQPPGNTGTSGNTGNSGSTNNQPTGVVYRGTGSAPEVSQIAKVSYTTPFTAPTSFDISFVDDSTSTDFLSDRTNDGIDAVNASTDTLEGVIGKGDFTGPGTTATAAQTAQCGSGTEGPNGELALTVGGVNQVWAGNGVDATSPTSAVEVFTVTGPGIATGPVSISTGGSCRADELAYDSTDHVVAIANDLDSPPYLSFISVNANPSQDKVLGKLTFPSSIDGLEQPLWDSQNDMLYVNVPQVADSSGAWEANVDQINPKTMSVVNTFPVYGCSAGGLQLDPSRGWLLVGCSSDAIKGDTVGGVTYPPNPVVTYVLNVSTGAVVKAIHQVGGEDEVAFNPSNNELYTASSSMTSNGTVTGYATPVLGVISLAGMTPRWVENVPTLASSHSVAVDSKNKEVFVPVSGYGIAVFAR